MIPTPLENFLLDATSKAHLREVPLNRRGPVFVFTFAVIIFLIFLVSFFYLGFWNHEFYSARAIRNVSGSEVKSAPRGVIYDRFDEMLVENTPSFNVVLVPRELPKEEKLREEAVKKASQLAGRESEELILEINARDWSRADRLILVSDASQEQLVEFETQKIPGVKLEPGFRRAVKVGAAHVVGYTGLVNAKDLEGNQSLVHQDLIGRTGLEAQYDNLLRGENGEDVIFRGEAQEKRTLREVVPGKNLKTFIDGEFQEFLRTRLSQALKDLGRDSGAALALNPQNGEVLALVSFPDFDVNKISAALKIPNQPLFNRIVSGRYNPGSTIKPLVASAALAEGIATSQTNIYSAGFIEIPNPYQLDKPSRFVEFNNHVYGWVDVPEALAKSSNIFFYAVGGGFERQVGLGIWKIKEWWQKFRLDQPTNIDLPSEAVGFLPDPNWKEKATGQPWRLGDTYNVAIGQGDFSITPLELLNYISAIANGGKLNKLRVVDPEPEVLKDLTPELSPILSYVRRGMKDAVDKDYGTAYLLHTLPLEIGAKTGSAQVENNSKTNAFFVGFAPFENPEVAILILIENAREGSSNTVPVAKDAFLWYYDHRLKTL
jgi:penicillin-binding protein 2